MKALLFWLSFSISQDSYNRPRTVCREEYFERLNQSAGEARDHSITSSIGPQLARTSSEDFDNIKTCCANKLLLIND